MSTLSEQQLAELRAEFQKDPMGSRATKAILRLKEKGCDPIIVLAYAGRVAGYKSGNHGVAMHKRGPQDSARHLRAIKCQLRKLAKRTVDLRRIWGLWGRMVEADCVHIPEELEEIANRLSRIQIKGYADWHPQRESLLDLLDHVRSSTGRYHYGEVSDIINGEMTWRAMKYGQPLPEFEYDLDNMKMMVQRWRKADRASIAKLSAPGPNEAQSISSATATNR